jgi:hypothetical protein
MAYPIEFIDSSGNKTEYLFDKLSLDVKFLKYSKNEIISNNPRIELVVEEWYIKSLDKIIEFKKTTKYMNNEGIRRNFQKYGKSTHISNTTSYGDDEFIEWYPHMLNETKNIEKVRKYLNKYGGIMYGQNVPYTEDLIFINVSNMDNMSDINKFELLINDINKCSTLLNNRNKKRNRPGLLSIPSNNKDIDNLNNNIINKKNDMKKLSDTNKNSNSGLFMPVHLRDNFNKFFPVTEDENNSKKELFKVPKNNNKYKFVIKGINNSINVTHTDIIDLLVKYSPTLSEKPHIANVFILKDKKTNKNKDICLVNFKNEKLKDKVLNECLKHKVLFNNCVLLIEDGYNN